MLKLAIEESVRRYLAAGKLSQREIAQAVGVSRGTVDAIANGKRRPALARGVADHAEFFSCSRPAVRCPGCGGLVYRPCHACFVRRYAARKRLGGPSITNPPNRPTRRSR